MLATGLIHFPPFYLDPTNEQLWRGTQQIPLRPKPFAILRYLMEHPGRLVTKEELHQEVWPGTHVSEGLLNTYIRDLRDILGDDPEAPRFIETVVRRGYRFIAPLTPQAVQSPRSQVPSPTPAPHTQHPAPPLVGREMELAQLHQWLETACSGRRQVVFVTGEPGIGKTALVDAFLQSLESSVQRLASEDQPPQSHPVQTLDPRRQTRDAGLWIGRGQCVAQYGTGEAYLPLLKALGRLGRGPDREPLVALLRRYAPSWLLQLPALLTEAETAGVQHHAQGVTRERMLRELVEALEALTAERPLVLVVEDLQWSDYSTLDWLTAVAQRREPARLLLLGTYRPTDVVISGHPLKAVKQELQVHGQCEDLPLGFLPAAAISDYLAVRFPRHQFPATLARLIHQSTEGNPLFMINVVQHLVAHGVIREVAGRWQYVAQAEDVMGIVPENLRQMIAERLDRLSPQEQRVLEAASVVGAEFSAAVVTAGTGDTAEQIEGCCEGLVRRGQFLDSRGMETMPDGTVVGRYRFLHALYPHVLYGRLAAAHRVRLHRRIGECLEEMYGGRAGEVAAQLAMHFEKGQDCRRAVQYSQQAAEQAMRRAAPREALQHVTTALALLKTLPDSRERTAQEIALQLALGVTLATTRGYADPDVGQAYARTRELCQQRGEDPQLFPALWGLFVFHLARAEFPTAQALAGQLLHLADREQDSSLLLEAHLALEMAFFYRGELAAARTHLQNVLALYDPQYHRAHAFLYGQDPVILGRAHASWALWLLGYPDQALQNSQETLSLAQNLAHPFSLAMALFFAVLTHQVRREGLATQQRAEETIQFASAQGLPYQLTMATILQGGELVRQGHVAAGIAQMRQALVAHQAAGAGVGTTYSMALLAEAYGQAGQIEEGLQMLAEALAVTDKNDERWWEAELHRLKGELLLAQEGKSKKGNEKKAVGCFHKAVAIACRQQAKSLELRAVMSLARLWRQRGRGREAHDLLAEVYNWFTEGFDTADLQEAKALLGELT